MKGKLSPHVTISGNLTEKPHVTASLSSQQSLSGALSVGQTINGKLTIGDTFYDNYDGPYNAVPKKDEDQLLETSGKRMLNNVTVSKISYWKTSNPQGGRTVYIGVE